MDLATSALHESYTTSNSVLIGDGTGLSIANIGSFSLTSLPTPLLFTNVLYVPTMSKNIISVFAICADNQARPWGRAGGATAQGPHLPRAHYHAGSACGCIL